jgi:hypothetical protein
MSLFSLLNVFVVIICCRRSNVKSNEEWCQLMRLTNREQRELSHCISAFMDEDFAAINSGQTHLLFTFSGLKERKAYNANLRIKQCTLVDNKNSYTPVILLKCWHAVA